MDKLGAHRFLFCCVSDSLTAHMLTAEGVVQAKQEVMLSELSRTIFRCVLALIV